MTEKGLAKRNKELLAEVRHYETVTYNLRRTLSQILFHNNLVEVQYKVIELLETSEVQYDTD
jgi:hypothetical protein